MVEKKKKEKKRNAKSKKNRNRCDINSIVWSPRGHSVIICLTEKGVSPLSNYNGRELNNPENPIKTIRRNMNMNKHNVKLRETENLFA